MKNTYKVFKEEINVNGSVKFLTVKEAAVELQLHINQIRHLISQNLIDHKLEDGKKFVDVNSIDELVMIDLKRVKNSYPLRKNYKLKSNKTIDKKIVIDSFINDICSYEGEDVFAAKEEFIELCGIDAKHKDIPMNQICVHNTIHNYHNNKKNKVFFIPCSKYTLSYLKDNEKRFYFLNTEEFYNSYDLIKITTYLECNSGNFSDKDAKHLLNEKLSKFVYENHLFYLTLDEFIKEFSPKKYYEKNKLWSMYLDKTEYVAEEAANDEEIKQLYTVNGFERNQPYGSRKNPKYKKIWINPFERGGKKVKMAA